MKLTTLLPLLPALAPAAPSTIIKTLLDEVMHRRIPSPIQASPTRAAAAAAPACTSGLPASKQHPAGGGSYPITNYTQVTPAAAEGWTSYAVGAGWYGDHFVSGPHVMGYTHKSEPYGPFKCQYTCNADASCSAYFVWYENVGTEDEHLKCVLFDAVIPASAFVETNGTITSGAYDKICERSS